MQLLATLPTLCDPDTKIDYDEGISLAVSILARWKESMREQGETYRLDTKNRDTHRVVLSKEHTNCT